MKMQRIYVLSLLLPCCLGGAPFALASTSGTPADKTKNTSNSNNSQVKSAAKQHGSAEQKSAIKPSNGADEKALRKMQAKWVPVAHWMLWLRSPNAAAVQISGITMPLATVKKKYWSLSLDDVDIKTFNADPAKKQLQVQAQLNKGVLTINPEQMPQEKEAGRKAAEHNSSDNDIASDDASDDSNNAASDDSNNAASDDSNKESSKHLANAGKDVAKVKDSHNLQISFGQAQLKANMQNAFTTNLITGDSELKLNDLTVQDLTSTDKKQLSMHGIDIDMQHKLDGNDYQSLGDLHFDRLSLGDFLMKSFDLKFKISGLNAEAIRKLRQVQMHNGQPSIKLEPQIFKDIIANGLDFNISDLQFDSSLGGMQSSMQITLPKQQSRSMSPLFILVNSSLHADITISQKLLLAFVRQVELRRMQAQAKHLSSEQSHNNSVADQDKDSYKSKSIGGSKDKSADLDYSIVAQRTDAAVQNAVQAGWLIEDGSNYKIKIDFSGAVLTINGKTVKSGMALLPRTHKIGG